MTDKIKKKLVTAIIDNQGRVKEALVSTGNTATGECHGQNLHIRTISDETHDGRTG